MKNVIAILSLMAISLTVFAAPSQDGHSKEDTLRRARQCGLWVSKSSLSNEEHEQWRQAHVKVGLAISQYSNSTNDPLSDSGVTNSQQILNECESLIAEIKLMEEASINSKTSAEGISLHEKAQGISTRLNKVALDAILKVSSNLK